jgi:hypothetical protein
MGTLADKMGQSQRRIPPFIFWKKPRQFGHHIQNIGRDLAHQAGQKKSKLCGAKRH